MVLGGWYGQSIIQILDSGQYISAIWENGQPARSVLIVDQTGTFFKGDLTKASANGTINKPKEAAGAVKKPPWKPEALRTYRGFEYFPDGHYNGGFSLIGNVCNYL
jgi:hypothetical protein